jgi:hypothetical protein
MMFTMQPKGKPMKIKLLFAISTLVFTGITHAQNDPKSGIVESTDPAKIADIERRAQALGAPAPGPASQKMPGMQREMPMHERMHGYKSGEKNEMHQMHQMHEHMHAHKHGAMHGDKHGDAYKHGDGYKHGAKHGDKQGYKGHAKMDGKGPHGAHPMMDGKGRHGEPMDATHGYPAKDAPAKP